MRCRSEWLQGGDRNTKFFHNSVTRRRRRNKIDQLEDSVGNTISSQSDLTSHICSYFNSLFTSQLPSDLSTPYPPLLPLTSSTLPQHTLSFSYPPSAEEVHEAVMSLHPLKAPGSDGFHAFFFHKHWEIVKEDVSQFISHIFSSKTLPPQINHTLLSLIPKVDSPLTIKQFRPIGLCNTIYKIVSKILVNRIRPVLPD